MLVGLVLSLVTGLGFVFLGIGVLSIWFGWCRCKTTELAVTNKKVVAKQGVISRNTIEMLMSKIESIHVKQGAIGRMFGLGSIVINGVGTGHAPISGIKNPMDFRRQFLQAQELIFLTSFR